MYSPHTVTLYNSVVEVDPDTFKDNESLYSTLLTGVFVDATKAVNVRQSGLESADAVSLYIPFTVSAKDPVTGVKKHFVKPQEFLNADDKTSLWTLAIDGQNGISTFFIKGEIVTGSKFKALQHAGCFNLTKVDEKDFGSADMRHWECGGA